MERWRDIVGFEGLYQVSDRGRIRSVDRVVPDSRHRRDGTRKIRARILTVTPNNQYGHLGGTLGVGGVQTNFRVHQVVAEAFLGPCPGGMQVRHGPSGKLDNSVDNLCYGTKSQDGLDKRRDGTHGGRSVRRSDGVEFPSIRQAAEETGCSTTNIWNVCNGRQKTAGGYGWEYAE